MEEFVNAKLSGLKSVRLLSTSVCQGFPHYASMSSFEEREDFLCFAHLDANYIVVDFMHSPH